MGVRVYALSTCPYCRMARKYLDERGVAYDLTEVDLLEGEPRIVAASEVKRLSGGLSFPVILIGEEVVVGFNKGHIDRALGL
ncbi:MAG: glutaredoxin family protein [Coriobacteriia bacterium]|nr:glutaredoxin family protein [Coriobacteriia bacterium]